MRMWIPGSSSFCRCKKYNFATLLAALVTILAGCADAAQPVDRPRDEIQTLTGDGAWCWFQDPRAVYHEGTRRRTYTGWMTKDGELQVGAYDLDTGAIETITLKQEWDVDDHNTPSFLVLPDGRLTVFYARHNKEGLFARTTLRPEDISAWNTEITVSDTDRITYSHPVRLSEENGRIFVFWRGPSWKPTFSFSDDGTTWSEPQILLQQSGRESGDIRPYLKVVSDGESTIHFAFTDGHPRVELTNSIYYMKYEAGGFYRADGSEIERLDSLPIDHRESDLVYDASANGARAWIWDVALDGAGHPILAYTRLPQETHHVYHYARWDGSQWVDRLISEAGGWFPQTPAGEEEREVHYSGGIVLNHADPSIVYYSRPVNGQFEIEKAVTNDGGDSWSRSPVTRSSSQLNVRPVFPYGYPGTRDHILWMHGKYVHYTDYETEIRFIAP